MRPEIYLSRFFLTRSYQRYTCLLKMGSMYLAASMMNSSTFLSLSVKSSMSEVTVTGAYSAILTPRASRV